MSDFTKLVITDAGARLLNRKLESDKELVFTEVMLSERMYDIDVLAGLTELDGIRQRATVRKIDRERNMIQISAVFSNSELEEGYYVNTLGVYAQLQGEPPTLFGVAIEQVRAAYMPQKSSALSGIEIKLKITLENADHITLQMDPSAMATIGDVLELEHSIQDHAGNSDNPHQTSKGQVGLGSVDNTSDMEKPVSTAQRMAIDEAYQQSTGYVDQKIADLINGAPSTLDTLGEIAQAMEASEDVVEALHKAVGSKTPQAEFDGHAGNNTIHVTASERQAWNGKQTPMGDTKENVTTFTSGDNTSPTGWTDVAVLASGEKHSNIFAKISTMFRNVRYLWKMLGNTDISAIGNGTVTGAISKLNTDMPPIYMSRAYAKALVNNPKIAYRHFTLPDRYASKDVNNYCVAVTLESAADAAIYMPFILKQDGQFDVCFLRSDGADIGTTYAIWFDMILTVSTPNLNVI